MKAEDVTDTLELALQASGLDQINVTHRPRLLSDNGPATSRWSWRHGSTNKTCRISAARPIIR